MSTPNEMRDKIRKELEEYVAKKKEQIKDYESKRSGTQMARATITGGLFAGTARNSCDAEINTYTRKINQLQKEIEWQEEMLKKYH